MNIEEFENWLELSTDLAEKTIRNYLGAMNKICSDLVETGRISTTAGSPTDSKSLETLRDSYFEIPENAELDQRGNGMYSAAFNKYITFMGSQGGKRVGKEGVVYILSNPAMPGLVKVGKTINLQDRMKSLFSTGVPLPFRCVYAKKVRDCSEVERKLHKGLNSHRENANREFFRIAEEEIINFLELVEGEDVTPREDIFEDKDDERAFEKATKIGQRFNFSLVQIPVGATLTFIRDDAVTCKVISDSRVEFEGDQHSLSSAALIATNRMGFDWKSIAGPLNWKFEGEVLAERRARLESSD
ncbi:GIY-YIG nuclease family protein [Luminiphilus sp.]|nr:GIY-YIG nuclease family protein [Luminiphilus sp.]